MDNKTIEIPDFSKKCMYRETTYTLTLNPDDSHQFMGKIDRFRKCIKKVLTKLSFIHHAHYTLTPEISKKGRIHFHGKLTVLHPVDFQLYDVISMMKWSIFEIDDLTHPTVWEAYVKKDLKLIRPYLHQKGIKYKITNSYTPKEYIPILDSLNHLEYGTDPVQLERVVNAEG